MLVVSLLILSISIPKSLQEENQLAPVINDLSIVARLINGISLQSDFMRSSQNLNAVVGELLGIGDSNAIPELLKLKVKDLMKDVDGILKDVKNISSYNRNLGAIDDAVKFLKSIDGEKLKKAVNQDLTTLEQKWRTAKTALIEEFYPSEFSNVVASLKHVLETPYDFVTKGVMGLIAHELRNFYENGTAIKATFDIVVHKLPGVQHLEDIMGTKAQISELMYISQVLREYMEYKNSLLSLPQSFADMKAAITDLQEIVKKSKATSATNQSLDTIGNLFSADKRTDKKLTAGLHKGISDLKLIFEDLNGKWMKENVADGKDMKMLITALEPLKKFYENLKPLETSWNKLKKDQKIREVVGSVAGILKNGKILKPDELAPQAEKAGKCFKTLQSFSASLALAKFDKFYNDLDALDENIPLLKQIVTKVKNSLTYQKITKFAWKTGAQNASFGQSYEGIRDETNLVRNNPVIREMTELIFEYAGIMERININGIREMISFFPTVVGIREDLTDIKLIAAIECLDKLNFDYTATEAFSRFDRGVEALKNQTDAQGSMKVFGDAIDSLISTDKKLKEMVRRRRKRSPEAKKLLKLADSGKLAQGLGNGVEVLREMSDVFENQERVLKVAKSGDIVDPVIQGIPEMNGKWTVDNKKALEKLVDEVNKLNANVDKNRSLESIWKQFGAAQSVSGAPIESQILRTLVAEVLDRNTDLNVKSVAPDFKDFPPLQLDFTGQKRLHLQQASGILDQITGFFKDFFTIDTSSSTQSSDSSPNYLLFAGAGAGGLALVVALGVGGYYGFRSYKRKTLWKNRERYWLYMLFRSEELEHEHALPKHIKGGRWDLAKRLIQEGDYVNAFVDGLSVLHIAVNHAPADVVELLILNGADMRALSHDEKTPEQSCDPKPMNPRENANRVKLRMEKVVKVLKKYKGKTFEQRLPKLLPYNKFVVYSLASDRSAAFKSQYQSKMKFSDENEGLTHLIVDVDDDGVYHYDIKKPKAMVNFYDVVFGPVIAVSSEWPKLCMKSVKNFYKDYDCRVKKVEFNGKVYTNVDELKEFARGRHIKYGHGINLTYLSGESSDNKSLDTKISDMGFQVFMEENMESKNQHVMDLNPKAKSFYRPDMKANFIVYDGESMDEFASKLNGVELKDYTVMSLDEFSVFLLEMKMTGGKGTTKTASTSKTTSTVKTME